MLITHDPGLAARARRVVKMRGGTVVALEEHGTR
jgi:predicted ABC-type transport system involved in lysophospholipase L1 biosynthesis ATPase subunit